ncbi:zinc metallopeptidase [Apibacter raozihei]|uniref:KPN_02809 family neutral zinc metallopeptidase n=1 Tax=Apibacter TaxID=1778601 RepID=UPI000FE3DFD7|nr:MULTISPECIES: neutral zinc metallopeptidase [Apibacter]
MKWEGRRQSSNLEDRRGLSGGGKAVLGGSGILIIGVIIFSLFTGKDPSQLLSLISDNSQITTVDSTSQELTPEEVKTGEFVSTILADTEEVWDRIFKENGLTYKQPKLVLFTNAVQTACGGASSAVGPFYCPADQKVYMDMSFFKELKDKYGAKGGDFAVAYVIAHEIGHHVQNLLGTSEKMQRAQMGKSEKEANKLSVALELQADFYAGVWAHYDDKINHVLEDGDIEDALSAANAVGDDEIQKKTQGQIIPDSFTHGTSKQRMYWFKKGFTTGDISQGDTFAYLSN